MTKEKRDLTGEQFGRWTVLRRGEDKHDKQGRTIRYWNCQCSCGVIKDVLEQSLLRGLSMSCGCIKSDPDRIINLTNQQFGRWTVLWEAPPQYDKRGYKKRMWHCRCSCENHTEKDVPQTTLISGDSQSCGCLKLEKASQRKHDLTGKKYGRWEVLYEQPEKIRSGKKIRVYHCRCECGTERDVEQKALLYGESLSCGCLHTEIVKETGHKNKQYNQYDLSGEYGIGFTSKGERFLFDLDDYERIRNFKWHISEFGYVCSTKYQDGKSKLVNFARLIMVAPDGYDIDHVSHDRADNRKINLRLSTRSQNLMNKGLHYKNTSGVTGVSYDKNRQKWRAYINKDGKQINLGYYNDFNDAVIARRKGEERYFGEYSFHNSMKHAQQYTT